MQLLHDECLKKYTTIKIGGFAKNLYFPESTDELIELLNKVPGGECYILGGGSNILINDQKTYNNVIVMTKVDTSIRNKGNGKFYVGASVRIQKLIDAINKEGFGGIEYLYSVPALVGGAVVMNAGRGKKNGHCISNYIEEVYAYYQGAIKVFSKQECRFDYRNSIFKNNKLIVLGVTFIFDKVNLEDSNKYKHERMVLVRKKQDNSGYNFGSVFNEQDRLVMQLIKLFHPGYKNGIAFSNKTSNWLINKGEGTYSQAVTLINRVIKLHRLLGKKATPEVVIWK